MLVGGISLPCRNVMYSDMFTDVLYFHHQYIWREKIEFVSKLFERSNDFLKDSMMWRKFSRS